MAREANKEARHRLQSKLDTLRTDARGYERELADVQRKIDRCHAEISATEYALDLFSKPPRPRKVAPKPHE